MIVTMEEEKMDPVLKQIDSFPPGCPYDYDGFNMGQSIGKDLIMMFGNHADAECRYVIFCDTKTGKRFKVTFQQEETTRRIMSIFQIEAFKGNIWNTFEVEAENKESATVQFKGAKPEWTIQSIT